MLNKNIVTLRIVVYSSLTGIYWHLKLPNLYFLNNYISTWMSLNGLRKSFRVGVAQSNRGFKYGFFYRLNDGLL